MTTTSLFATLFFAALAGANGALEVIGSGFGRTGTNSLRMALNTLGYKTYHMKVIVDERLSDHLPVWKAAAESNCANIEDVKSLFEKGGFTAAVDFPASMCWEALMEVYPKAKVVHTERATAEEWYDSASNSIMIVNKMFPVYIVNKIFPFFIAHKSMVESIWSHVANRNVTVSDKMFPEIYKEEFLSSYTANNERVRKAVPRKRLLVQEHSQGWQSLCKFLGKDVPDEQYPLSNTREQMRKKVRQRGRFLLMGLMTSAIFLLLLIGWGIRKIVKGRNKVKEV